MINVYAILNEDKIIEMWSSSSESEAKVQNILNEAIKKAK